MKHAALTFLAATVLLPLSALAQDYPRFTDHVVDVAGVVDDGTEDALNEVLSAYEDRTERQIAIAVVESIGSASIEDYANDLFEEWGVGPSKEDTGVLLVIAMEQRELRIEVGFGLEDELTDIESGRIIRDVIVPRMREGHVGKAISDGVFAMGVAIDGEGIGAAPTGPVESDDDRLAVQPWWFLIPFLVFGPLSSIGRRGRRRRGWASPVFWGGIGSGGFSGGFGGGGGGGGFSGGGGGGSGGGGASGGW